MNSYRSMPNFVIVAKEREQFKLLPYLRDEPPAAAIFQPTGQVERLAGSQVQESRITDAKSRTMGTIYVIYEPRNFLENFHSNTTRAIIILILQR